MSLNLFIVDDLDWSNECNSLSNLSDGFSPVKSDTGSVNSSVSYSSGLGFLIIWSNSGNIDVSHVDFLDSVDVFSTTSDDSVSVDSVSNLFSSILWNSLVDFLQSSDLSVIVAVDRWFNQSNRSSSNSSNYWLSHDSLDNLNSSVSNRWSSPVASASSDFAGVRSDSSNEDSLFSWVLFDLSSVPCYSTSASSGVVSHVSSSTLDDSLL